MIKSWAYRMYRILVLLPPLGGAVPFCHLPCLAPHTVCAIPRGSPGTVLCFSDPQDGPGPPGALIFPLKFRHILIPVSREPQLNVVILSVIHLSSGLR